MKYRSLRTAQQALAEDLRNPEFRAEWERTAPARAVALHLTAFRAEHRLSQSRLAERLGVSQAYVAELESGEHNPRLETLARLSAKLGIEFIVSIEPLGRASRSRRHASSVEERALQTGVVEGSKVVVAARPVAKRRRS